MKTLFLILCLATPVISGELSSQTPGLVAYIKFDEGSGMYVRDASGHGLNGTIEGTTAWVSGIHGSAMEFISNDSKITTPNTIPSNTGFSLGAWFFVTPRPFDNGVGYSLNLTDPSFSVYQPTIQMGGLPYGVAPCDPNQNVLGATYVSVNVNTYAGGINNYMTWGCVRADNSWSHIVANYIQGSNTVEIYINGVRSPHTDIATALMDTGNLTLSMGDFPGFSGGLWAGMKLDDVFVFNKGLTSGEIQRIYTSSLGRYSNVR